MQKVEKQSMPVILDENGDPKAIVFFNKHRDRIIFMVEKAGEDEIFDLLQTKEPKE